MEEEDEIQRLSSACSKRPSLVVKRNASFANMVQELESATTTPEGSVHGIKRVSGRGMVLGVGASSRQGPDCLRTVYPCT